MLNTIFYEDRETKFEFKEIETGEVSCFFSNYKNYNTVAAACGYRKENEGTKWNLERTTTYPANTIFKEGYTDTLTHKANK